MRVSFSRFALVLALTGISFSATPSVAEFRCAAEISYRWVKTPEDPPPVPPGPPAALEKGKKDPPPAPTRPPPPPTPEPAMVKMMGIERSGADEAAAKAALQVEADKQRIRASDLCKRDHESFGSCLATKLSNRASVLNSLSFKTRQELEKALSDECKRQQGTCISVEVSEAKCSEVGGTKAGGSPPVADKKADTKKK